MDGMKYRLRTLFVVILLAGIGSAVLARMQYLASRSAYHDHKAQEYGAKIMQLRERPGSGGTAFDLKKQLTPQESQELKRYFSLVQHHSRLMLEYRYATYRPWRMVDETEVKPN
jgi:hypothetical protein